MAHGDANFGFDKFFERIPFANFSQVDTASLTRDVYVHVYLMIGGFEMDIFKMTGKF